MKQEEWNEGLDHLDPDLVEQYVEKKDLIRQRRGRRRKMSLGALAACLALILGILPLLGLFREGVPELPIWDTPQLSAEEIALLFPRWEGETNAYQKITVANASELKIYPIPTEEYLPIYQYTYTPRELDSEEMQRDARGILERLSKIASVPLPPLKSKTYPERISAWGDVGLFYVSITQSERAFSFSFDHTYGDLLTLDGIQVTVDQRESDEELLRSLEPLKRKLFSLFGASFSDAYVIRRYSDSGPKGAWQIEIVFFNKKTHPLNSLNFLIGDKIRITLRATEAEKWEVGTLSNASITYTKYRSPASDDYIAVAKTKMLSLEEAEALLYRGYTFGGHTCHLCMAEQEKISFEGYDFVGFEYQFPYEGGQTDKSPAMGVPFYTFYKQIGTSPGGNPIYAKTYVPAIEVTGMEEYFQKAMEFHGS